MKRPSPSCVVGAGRRAAPRGAGRCRRPGGRATPSSSGSPQTMHRPGQSGRSQRRDRLGERDRLADRRSRGRARGGRSGGARRVRSSIGTGAPVARSMRRQDLLVDPERRAGSRAGRRQRTHSSARAVVRSASARMPRFVRASRTCALDRRRRAAGRRAGRCVAPRDVVRRGRRRARSASSPATFQTSGPSRPGSDGHGRMGCGRVLVLAGSHSALEPARRRRRSAAQAGRAPLVEHRDPLLDALERLDDVALEADEDARPRTRRRRAGSRRRRDGRRR